MSLWYASLVALVYASGVIFAYRWGLGRRRRRHGGLPVLATVDWEFLCEPLLRVLGAEFTVERLLDGPGPDEATQSARLSEAEQAWLELLREARHRPELALLRAFPTPADARSQYLFEALTLRHEVGVFNLEWQVVVAKRRLKAALKANPDVAALYFVRAYASWLLGLTDAAIDDMGRAVYYGRRPFYARAVVSSPLVAEVRPDLFRQCERTLSDRPGFG